MKKLRDYAREHNVTYRTAYNHFRKGLISGAYQLPTGTVVIPDYYQPDKAGWIVTYARVSSSQNKENLESQSERLISYCNAKGWKTHENIKEIGSGINDDRKKLLKIFKDNKATKLVVEHKDRLTRFGFNYVKELCSKFGCEIVIINESESKKEDLIQDFVSIITSFCAKIYGHRRNKRKTEKLIKDLEKN
ncbi:MAG TPA: IS607 family transposase [candidate division Zixibacteria bacterium]|nr:IS607 family transposase [candidate division Zixibacteria bacterium]